MNVRVGHSSKGHQSKDGKVFAAKEYVSQFSFANYHKEFREQVLFFFFFPSQKTYVDGAVYHNNPIRIAEAETKLIWPDIEYSDVLLSLGTSIAESERMGAEQKGIVSHGLMLFNILKNHMATSLDCEHAWNDYLSHLPESTYSSRYFRINPELTGKVPTLDETGEMIPLQTRVQSILRHDERIKKLALQLITSTFYFQLLTPISKSRRWVPSRRLM